MLASTRKVVRRSGSSYPCTLTLILVHTCKFAASNMQSWFLLFSFFLCLSFSPSHVFPINCKQHRIRRCYWMASEIWIQAATWIGKGRRRASQSSDSSIFWTEIWFSCPLIFENGHSLSGWAKSMERVPYDDKGALIKTWPFVAAPASLACPGIKVTLCCFNKTFQLFLFNNYGLYSCALTSSSLELLAFGHCYGRTHTTGSHTVKLIYSVRFCTAGGNPPLARKEQD